MQVRSTKGQIQDFLDSMLWKDMLEELAQLDKRATLEYDLVGEEIVTDDGHKRTPTTSETLIHLGDIKGRRKAVQYFRSMPEIFLSILEDKQNDLEHKRADGPEVSE